MDIVLKSNTSLRVRYGETDQMGYCYYGNYAQYFEVGRVEALREMGMSYRALEESGVMLPVSEYNVKYKFPAKYDDLLTITTYITELDGVRLRFDYEIHNESGRNVANASTTLIFVDKQTMKPTSPPKNFVDLIRKKTELNMSNDLAKISFDLFGESDIDKFLSPRQGETKIGEKIATYESTRWKSVKYVIIGVEESVGPRANRGRGGAEHAFKAFLSKFLNMQSNDFFNAKDIAVLGRVKVDSEEDTLNDSVESLDQFINKTITDHLKHGQFPILIGGGHNNSLPLIKFLSTLHANRINVVNLDAHADYRLLEGRHSGNSFSYAYDQGWLNHYEVFGLHYQYNSQQIFDDLKRDGHNYTLHESYVTEERNYYDDFKKYLIDSNVNIPLGVELDLDSIERMPSSAFTPVGVTMNEALRYLRTMAKHEKVGYLHLPEGAPTNDDESIVVGKTLAYLVTDFIRSHCNANKLY